MALAPVMPLRPTRKVVGYKIVSDNVSNDMQNMETKVLRWLNQGYELQGLAFPVGNYSLVQILVKYEN